MAEINVVPLIDVMLVLLIVFMITAPLITQGIKVDLPQADAEPVENSDETTLVVSINSEGEYFISLGAEEDPQPVPLERIQEDVTKILTVNPAVPVFVEADNSVNYGVVTRLMSTLAASGADNLRLITQPPSAEN
ncbi:MAG: protein TolR [Gammaproteobacteria bacterium]|jgi:biopolymer transport protein TolR|nr:protein TolR [Gammaproteobacteria bacterium]